MSLTLTILLSLFSAGILAGRVYEILNLTDVSTGFLLVNGIVMNPYILGIFVVIALCCGILIFSSYKTVKPYYSKSSKYTAVLAGAAFIAAGGFAFKVEIIAPFFIAGGAALIVMAITDLGKKKTDIAVMLLMLAFAAGMCMDVVSFNVSTYHNTVFMQNVLEYLCISVFMLMMVKNVYMPSKHSRMMLYVTGMLTFAVCSMMNIADIICYVMTGGQSLYQVLIYVAMALFGIFAFDTAVSAIPSQKEIKKDIEDVQKHDVTEYIEKTETKESFEENIAENTVEAQTAENETVEAEETESEKEELSVAKDEIADAFAQSELEQMFDTFAEEKADNNFENNEIKDIAQEVVLKEETENDISKYAMVSELFGAQAETEITAQLPQNIFSETRSFKKFSQPKLEESAPEYDMLKSMFKGEDTSQYQLDVEDNDIKKDKKQLQPKQKRSLFSINKKEKIKEEKTVEEKVVEKKDIVENVQPEKTEIIHKNDSTTAKQTEKTKFVSSESRKKVSKTETKKIVYKKPK